MHKPIPVVSIDGGAKTSKSTVCTAIAEILATKMRVKTADAGAFYRRVTAAVFDVLDVDDFSQLTDETIDEAIDQVLADGTAFQDDYPWGDLERPSVSRWVSVVGKRTVVQKEADLWWTVTADQAASFDVLVVNGRNPRLRLTEQVAAGKVRVLMELFTECEPREAARRKLLGHGITDFTEQQLADETQGIIDRRNLDLTRPTDPFIVPDSLVPYTLGSDALGIIKKTWRAKATDVPLPIRFDTTNMTKDEMIKAAQALALAALDFD